MKEKREFKTCDKVVFRKDIYIQNKLIDVKGTKVTVLYYYSDHLVKVMTKEGLKVLVDDIHLKKYKRFYFF